MNKQGFGCKSGQDIVYVTHTHSGTSVGMVSSSAAPLSQHGNVRMICNQHPIYTSRAQADMKVRTLTLEDAEFDVSLERSIIENADVWSRLAEL